MPVAFNNTIYRVYLAGSVSGITFNTLPQNAQTLLDSTIIALGAAGVYNSAGLIAVPQYSWVVGTCFADQSGTLNIQFSPDGVNIDAQTSIPYVANMLQGFIVDVVAGNFNLNFVNGAIAQTVFRLYAFGRNI